MISTFQTILWVALPYVATVTFLVGLAWRYKYDQYGWTSRSSQWNESFILRWASPLFHFGMLCVIGGHFVGLVVPKSFTTAVGISQHVYHLGATWLGFAVALATVIGLLGLLYRRFVVKSVRLATTKNDIITYILLCIPIALGTWATLSSQVLGGHEGYDYRETISVWFRSVFVFNPQAHLMVETPLAFQLHIVSGMLLFCIWPFTRLVHVVSAPVGYFTRPYIVYRSRGHVPAKPRGW